MSKPQYPTDLTDNQWKLVNELIPPAKSGGRPRRLEMRLVLNPHPFWELEFFYRKALSYP